MVYGYDPANDPAASWAKNRFGTTTTKKTALAPSSNKTPSSIARPQASSGETQGPIDLSANNPIANIVRRNSNNPTPMRDNIPDSIRRPEYDTRQSLFDELMGKITSDWGGIDKSKIDYSPLDAALNTRLGALNGIKDTTQQNFDKSDVALEAMHNALKNNIQTEGAQSFNNIADTGKANLQADNQKSQDYIANIKAQDMARRTVMLQNLGLTAPSAASEDTSADPLNQAAASIASRNDANVTNVEQDRGTNLAYNQNTANAVGQQGVERRDDLARQLQQIFGKVEMAKADAQSQNAQDRLQLEQNAGNQQYQQWRDKQGFLSDTLGQLQQEAADQAKAAASQKPTDITGFAGLATDLRNSGYDDPQIQNGLGVLGDVVGSPDYLKNSNSMAGNDKVSLLMQALQKNGVDRNLAFQLATNYANLGSTSKYAAQPY